MSEPAVYIIVINNRSTALCDSHAQAFENIMRATQQEPDIWLIDPEDRVMECAACALVNRSHSRIILPH